MEERECGGLKEPQAKNGKQARPLSTEEKDTGQAEETEHGVRIFISIGGHTGSSTRTELAAGILALSADGPLHVGSDSQAFVGKANYFIQSIKDNKEIYQTWELTSDGDLWEHFFNSVTAKGVHAIKISWVKGHAKQHHIDEGITTETKKEGNDEADRTADIGTELHGKEVMKLANIYHRRHDFYIKFMKEVLHHIIEAYLIHRRLTDIKENAEARARKLIDLRTSYSPLQYPADNICRPITIKGGMYQYKGYALKVVGSAQY